MLSNRNRTRQLACVAKFLTTTLPASRAKRGDRHAEEPSWTHIVSGEAAMKEVAKPNGVWDWVLVGPNPEKLALAAYGAGGLKELKSAIGKQCRAFGLLRLVTKGGAPQFIYVHTSLENCAEAMALEHNMEQVVRHFAPISGKVFLSMAMALESKMEQVVRKFAPISGKVLLSMEMFQQKSDNLANSDNSRGAAQAHNATAPQPQPQMPRVTSAGQGFDAAQRRPVKIFQTGASVEVFCSELQRWFTDGQVIEVVHEGCARDGFKLRAGSMKVSYDNSARFVWVAPQTAAEFVRPPSQAVA